MKSSLADFLWPRPTAVEICGRRLVLHELRVQDMATLDHFVEEWTTHQIIEVGNAPLAASYRDLRLAGVQVEPCLCNGFGLAAVFGSEQGWALLLRLAARDADLAVEESERIAGEMGDDDRRELRRAAFRLGPGNDDTLLLRLMQVLGVRFHGAPGGLHQPNGEHCPMARAVLEVVQRNRMLFDEVGKLTLSQLRALRRGHRPAGTPDPIFDWSPELVAIWEARPKGHPLIGGFAGSDGASA